MLAVERFTTIPSLAKRDFPEWFRAMRGKQSQVALGRELGVSYTTIASWEKGGAEPQAGNLVLIGKRFGVDFNTLMSHFGAPKLKGLDRITTAIGTRPRLRRLFEAASELPEQRLAPLVTFAEALRGEQAGELEVASEGIEGENGS